MQRPGLALSRCASLCPLSSLPSALLLADPPLPSTAQTFLLWLCTFHTNVVTCWLFFSLAILFWLLAAGVGNDPTIT